MSGNGPMMIENTAGTASPEIFALTDEQILGIEAEGADVQDRAARGEQASDRGDAAKGLTPEGVSYRDEAASRYEKTAQAGVPFASQGKPVPQEPPGWLAREMKDPWVGDEARELWEGVQRAQREAAAYREVFGTPEDARALKEIYPGGVAEAKGAAERARELAEIDAVFFGAVGKPAEELRTGRTALVEKLYAQNPAAFREMVEEGARLLEKAGTGTKVASGPSAPLRAGEWRVVSEESRSLHSESQTADGLVREQQVRAQENSSTPSDGKSAQPGVAVPQEVVNRYREFERATNAELEMSVGGAIGRAMEAALPNLRQTNAGREEPFGQTQGKQAPPLQERLRTAVREDVELALRSDASLGEQVARVLSGRRLDEAARAQVVRLIGARAQQLVPGAVRRVVGSWTQATLGARKLEAGEESASRSAGERRAERAPSSLQRAAVGNSSGERNAQSAEGSVPRGRVDYRKFSDEQILGM